MPAPDTDLHVGGERAVTSPSRVHMNGRLSELRGASQPEISCEDSGGLSKVTHAWITALGMWRQEGQELKVDKTMQSKSGHA